MAKITRVLEQLVNDLSNYHLDRQGMQEKIKYAIDSIESYNKSVKIQKEDRIQLAKIRRSLSTYKSSEIICQILDDMYIRNLDNIDIKKMYTGLDAIIKRCNSGKSVKLGHEITVSKDVINNTIVKISHEILNFNKDADIALSSIVIICAPDETALSKLTDLVMAIILTKYFEVAKHSIILDADNVIAFSKPIVEYIKK